MISVVVENKEYEEYIEVIDKKDINHFKNVFRMKQGDKIRAVDGCFEYLCEIKNIENDIILLKIIEKKEDTFSLNVEIVAGISLLKNEKMDMCIQKLAELGISKFIPLLTKRCVAKLEKKKDKWDKIVIETMKQCQGVNPMKIVNIKKLSDINFDSFDLIIVPYECEDYLSFKESLKDGINIKKILYIIGPEGGFDKEEIEYLKQQNAKIITLGKRILRAETAAIVTGGILINEFQ